MVSGCWLKYFLLLLFTDGVAISLFVDGGVLAGEDGGALIELLRVYTPDIYNRLTYCTNYLLVLEYML